MIKSVRQKGARGEREVIEMLIEWLTPVYEGACLELPVLQRNLEQWRSGGYDILGLDWLALEVKRHERSNPYNMNLWWAQTLAATKEGQVPLLLWRANRTPWAARTRLWVHNCPTELDVDLGFDQVKTWFQYETWSRIKKEE